MSTSSRSRRIGRAWVVGLCVLSTCGLLTHPASGSAPRVATNGDRSAKVFDPSVVHTIEFGVAPQDLATLGPGSDERVPAAMRFDGVDLDPVGFRIKSGFASAQTLAGKPGFSIKTDEYLDDQALFGVEKFTLGNELNDPSFIAEQIAYDVWRAAGIPAPRTALANVTLNDEPFGLYVIREGYDKQFLRRHFSDPDGNLYEASVAGVDMADQLLEARTNEEVNDKADIAELAQVVETVPDDQYVTELSKLVDLDEVFKYWAVEELVAHFDGYLSGTGVPFGNTDPAVTIGNDWSNNYYTYHDPRSDKFVVLPHGADWSLGNLIGLVPLRGGNIDWQYMRDDTFGGASVHTLEVPKPGARTIARLTALPGTEDRLRRNLAWAVKKAWNTRRLLAHADQTAELVRANGPPTARETWTPEQFEESFAARRSFIEHRAELVLRELGLDPDR